MSLSFASAVGSLFNRLGKIAALAKNLRSYQNTQLTAMTDTTSGVVAQLNAESDIQAIMGSAYLGVLSSSAGTIGGVAQQLAAAVVNRMIFRDNPRYGQTLQSSNTVESLREVIRQMKAQGATVLAQTITATPGGFTGAGDGCVTASVRRPLDGKVLENAYAENLLLTCTSDSYTGGRAAGSEGFALNGVGAQTDPFAFNWPLGSNASVGLTAIDGSADNTSGNILTNSGYDSWAGGAPDGHEILTGGALIAQENSLVFGAGSALKLTGDGSTLTAWRQAFADGTNGTAGQLNELSQYGFALFLRRDGVAAAAGTLVVELVDSSGTVIQDEDGNNNSLSIDLTALTTSYAAYRVAFRTPLSLPGTYYIRYRLSAALTNGRSVYLDRGGLGTMTQAYRGGPYLCVHSGATPFELGDYATAAVTNSRGSGGALDTWQTALARLLPEMMANELLLPSSATPSVSDALIG